eukprot:9474551-Pyramimonas_sp.AAC.1
MEATSVWPLRRPFRLRPPDSKEPQGARSPPKRKPPKKDPRGVRNQRASRHDVNLPYLGSAGLDSPGTNLAASLARVGPENSGVVGRLKYRRPGNWHQHQNRGLPPQGEGDPRFSALVVIVRPP